MVKNLVKIFKNEGWNNDLLFKFGINIGFIKLILNNNNNKNNILLY